jgi:hypothetical protein
VTDDDLPTHAPTPGDPRDPGPRPPATIRDGAWIALGAGLALLTVVQLAALVRALTGGELPALGTGGLLLGFAFTVLWLLTVSWFVLGAWRRSVWGCPFSHTRDRPAARRCPRHPLLDPPDAGPGPPQGPGDSR